VLHQKQRTRIDACIATAEFEDVRIGSISDRTKGSNRRTRIYIYITLFTDASRSKASSRQVT